MNFLTSQGKVGKEQKLPASMSLEMILAEGKAEISS